MANQVDFIFLEKKSDKSPEQQLKLTTIKSDFNASQTCQETATVTEHSSDTVTDVNSQTEEDHEALFDASNIHSNELSLEDDCRSINTNRRRGKQGRKTKETLALLIKYYQLYNGTWSDDKFAKLIEQTGFTKR